MTLIKSISGIRGTIGGTAGENLTPLDAVKFAAGYGAWLKERKCEAAQGYYFSPALPPAKIPTLASVTFQASSKNSRQAG